MNEPEYIVIHHSLTKDGTTNDWEAIRKYHKETNGWDDIGYHYGIERVDGELVTHMGRLVTIPGAHTKEMGMNSKSIGICVVGNYDLAPPDLQILEVLVDICHSMMEVYNIPVEKVIGHRDVGLMAGFDWRKVGPTGIREYKTCPGVLFPMHGLQIQLRGAL